MEFRVIQGDIAEERADALVNAAGTSLRMGSGVAGALRRGASGPINEEAMSEGPIELGEVATTDAYNLNSQTVIHAAAMPHYGDGQATVESIQEATRNSLETADERGYESLVIPILGTGAAGFSFEDGAYLVCEVVWNYDAENLSDVRVIAYSQSEYQLLEEIAADIQAT